MDDRQINGSDEDVIVPVVSEEIHAGAIPVVTGGVRVTKRVHTHDEVLQQQLRTSRAEIRRVQTHRVVDGPQPVRHEGSTLIIPVVSEILRIEKQWVVTEEIHIVQTEQTETVEHTVPVSREEALIERTDASGASIAPVDAPLESSPEPASIAPAPEPARSSPRLGAPRSILSKKTSA